MEDMLILSAPLRNKAAAGKVLSVCLNILARLELLCL